jgi:hypothetical protein
VVGGQQEQVVRFVQLQERRPEKRPARQIERAPRLFGGNTRSFCLADLTREMPEIHSGQRYRRYRRDDLHRLAVHGHERGTERLVATDNLLEAALERSRVHWKPNAHRRMLVVKRIAGNQLIQKPQPLLGERWRKAARAGRGTAAQRGRCVRGTIGWLRLSVHL